MRLNGPPSRLLAVPRSHRHEIFRQFLSLIAGAGTQHTGVKPEDFTEEMMVSLPMDNYEDLKVSEPSRLGWFEGPRFLHKSSTKL